MAGAPGAGSLGGKPTCRKARMLSLPTDPEDSQRPCRRNEHASGLVYIAILALLWFSRLCYLRERQLADGWCRASPPAPSNRAAGLHFDTSRSMSGAQFEVAAQALYKDDRLRCHGPRKTLCIATITSDLPKAYLAALRANRLAYAHRHRYAYCETSHVSSSRQPSWSKVLMIAALRSKCKNILWMDADSVFTNFREPLTRPLQELRRVDLLFTAPVGPRSLPWPYSGACSPTPRFARARRYWEDVVRSWSAVDDDYPNGVLGGGSFLMRSCAFTRDWLARIYMRPYGILRNQTNSQWSQCAGRYAAHEEGAINRWLTHDTADARLRAEFYLQQHLNTAPCEWRPRSLMLHAPGLSLQHGALGPAAASRTKKYAFLVDFLARCTRGSNRTDCAQRLCAPPRRRACRPAQPTLAGTWVAIGSAFGHAWKELIGRPEDDPGRMLRYRPPADHDKL